MSLSAYLVIQSSFLLHNYQNKQSYWKSLVPWNCDCNISFNSWRRQNHFRSLNSSEDLSSFKLPLSLNSSLLRKNYASAPSSTRTGTRSSASITHGLHFFNSLLSVISFKRSISSLTSLNSEESISLLSLANSSLLNQFRLLRLAPLSPLTHSISPRDGLFLDLICTLRLYQ